MSYRSGKAFYAWREQICNNYPNCDAKRAPGGILCEACEAKERALVELAKGGRRALPLGWQVPIHKASEENDDS